MKNLITILAVLLLPALAIAQFPNAPSKVVQGRQTTALGTVFHKAGLPAFTPTNWRNDVSVVIDTLTDITWKWSWDASEWQAQGLFFSAVTPPSLTVVSGASHNYTKAIWQGTTGLLSYYDQNTSAWAAIAISDGVGADSVSVLQDSIIALYAGGIEISRDTIGYPEQAGSQNLSFSGDTLSISGGNSVILPYSSEIADTAAAVRADFPVVTDNQTVSLSNDSLSIQRGNTLYLPYGDAIVDTAAAIRGDFPIDTDAQNLSFSNDTISIERGNSIYLPYSQNLQDTSIAIRADFPVDTDAQNLSLSNDTLYIERGNNVFLPYADALVDTAAAIRGDFPVNTDAQTLSITNDTLSILGGNSVPLAYEPVFRHCVLTASGGTVTFDAVNCTTAYLLLAGDYAFNIINATIGFYTVRVDQDATGGRTVTYTNNPMTQEASAIEIGTAANSKSILIFYYDGTNFLLETGKNYGN